MNPIRSDLVPHLAYGAAGYATLRALERSDDDFA